MQDWQANRQWKQATEEVLSALAVPAPDSGVITHSNEDAAVTTEAGLADSGSAAGQR